MTQDVEIGKEYFHYKDNTKKYKVLLFGKMQIGDERCDMQEVVIYEPLYEAPLGKVWVRPLSEFKEKFTKAQF